jgi:hypothetical protein
MTEDTLPVAQIQTNTGEITVRQQEFGKRYNDKSKSALPLIQQTPCPCRPVYLHI